MENLKPTSLSRVIAGLLLAAALSPMVARAGDPVGSGNGALDELDRRLAATQEAQELLKKGDAAYEAGKYQDAVDAYSEAFAMLPEAPASREIREATKERYAQAAVESSKALSRKGDVAGAQALLDRVLADGVAPENLAAKQQQARLNDPIRTNPALDKEHAQNVDEVRQLLYTAEGAYNLGKYDEAIARCEDVLRIDPYNKAARRMMERVAQGKRTYGGAAYDHARAELLSEVDAAWEMQVPPSLDEANLGTDGYGAVVDGFGAINTKLKDIVLPRVALDQVSLQEAVDFLRAAAMQADTTELDPANKGVNITVNLGPQGSELEKKISALRFSLQLSQVPLETALRYVTEQSQTKFEVDEFAVIIKPAAMASGSEAIFSRNYRVPPDFLSSLSGAVAGAEVAANDDPFAEGDKGGSLLTKSLSAQEVFEKNNIAFPEGTSVTYSPANSMLLVTQTPAGHEAIAGLVAAVSQTEPVIVTVDVKMIRTQQTNLEELGYDWLVNPFTLNGENTVFGSGGVAGNSAGRTVGSFVNPNNALTNLAGSADTAVSSGLVTGGLRSGDTAFDSSAIDGLINNVDRNAQTTSVAPGIFGMTGLFTDGEVEVLMRGLNQKKGTDVLIRPSVTTRSGQSSKIYVGREFIYPTEYEPPELPNSVGAFVSGDITGLSSGTGFPVTPATPTAFETRETGVTLEVLPVVSGDKNFVDVTLNPQLVEFDGFVNYGSPITQGSSTTVITENRILMPVFSTQRANTQLMILDGATIAFGGLLTDKAEKVEDKVPILGDLPLVGRAFRSEGVQRTATAVVFLLHVEVQDPTGRKYHAR